MVVVERKMMEEENTKRYRLLEYPGMGMMGMMRMIVVLVWCHLSTKKARPAVRTLMPATMTGQRCGSMVDPDCWKMVVMKKTMVEMPVHWARM